MQPVLIVTKQKRQLNMRFASTVPLMMQMSKWPPTYNIIKRLVPMGTRGVIQDQQVKWLQIA